MPQLAPYGSWKSPITSDLIVADTVGLSGIRLEGDDTYWLEMRPREGGRMVVVRRTPDGATIDLTPPPFNARTRVHEYGGGSYLVHDRVIFFSNYDDQRVYRQAPGQAPRPITPAGDVRYADYIYDSRRHLLFAVCEDHTQPGEAINSLVKLNPNGDPKGGQVIVYGNDFYSSPRLSPDGSRLAWLTWNHPNMPWDGTELWVGALNADGTVGRSERVAGGPSESIFQPEWSPDGTLYFVSDRTGWWNLYRLRGGKTEALHPMEAEFGNPQWVFDMSTYAFESPQRIICCYYQGGSAYLASLDTDTLEFQNIVSPFTDMEDVNATTGRAVLLAGSPGQPEAVVRYDTAFGEFQLLRLSSQVEIDTGYLSVPQAIEFPTDNGLTAYAFFYPPVNRDFRAPEGEKPPLLVMSHGGPTAAASNVLNPRIQYWTSRGIAVLDVNYGGSTGYGRAYRERLKGQWGVVDMNDCANGARYLVERGLVDGNRLMITGGSAGGYTTLCALTFLDVFKAGASNYGIGDLMVFVGDTHKFESRYLNSLVGPYPERRDLYEARSPIYHIDQLAVPLILFQGLEDKIVPPNQAELMFEAVRAKGLPVAYLAFEGEQHGFRRAENIKRSLDGALYFFSRVFGFDLAEPIEPVPIENLKA